MNPSEIIAGVAKHQPRLRYEGSSDRYVYFSGIYVLRSSLGPFDTFDIKLAFPLEFPRDEPVVWETSGRLPRDIDRHVYPDGSCCITVWQGWLIREDEISIDSYFDGPLNNFFLSQHHFEKHSSWPFGEWRHGTPGKIDALAQAFDLRPDPIKISKLLIAALAEKTVLRDLCFCGSGKTLGRCHIESIRRVQKRFGPEVTERLARELLDMEQRKVRRRDAELAVLDRVFVSYPGRSLKEDLRSTTAVRTLLRKSP